MSKTGISLPFFFLENIRKAEKAYLTYFLRLNFLFWKTFIFTPISLFENLVNIKNLMYLCNAFV